MLPYLGFTKQLLRAVSLLLSFKTRVLISCEYLFVND